MNTDDAFDNTISVKTSDVTIHRGGAAPRELKIEVLAENVKLFLGQIEVILKQTPEQVEHFRLTEFTVTAEITAKGGLVLLGTGIEASGTGGLVFKFERVR